MLNFSNPENKRENLVKFNYKISYLSLSLSFIYVAKKLLFFISLNLKNKQDFI